MSDPSARELHEAIMMLIRFSVPNQVMIDDVWVDLRRDARFVQSYDNYHFGCMAGTPGGREALEELAKRLGRMIDGATRVICALDYPWKEIWGDDIKKKEYDAIVSPRSRYGQATLPGEVRVDSGGYPAGTAPGSSAAGAATSTAASGASGGYPAAPSERQEMANVNVRAQIDRLSRGDPLTRPVVMEPAKIKEPKVRAEPVIQVPGPGSISVDQDHIWAFSILRTPPSILPVLGLSSTRPVNRPTRCGWALFRRADGVQVGK